MEKIKNLFKSTQIYVLLVLVIYCVIVSLVNPQFATLENIFDIIRNCSAPMVFAMGVMLVMVADGIDVSFAIISVFSTYAAIIAMKAFEMDQLWFGFLITMLVGALLGVVNALIIHLFKVPTFIATLGTQTIFIGLLANTLGTTTIKTPQMPISLVEFGSQKLITIVEESGKQYGLYIYIIPVVIIVVFTAVLLKYTKFGRSIVAMGNSKEAARRAGYNLFKTRIILYTLVGVYAGIAGLMYISQTAWIAPMVNNLTGSIEMTIIAAVVIGGTQLTGGYGTVVGSILGVILMRVFSSTLIFLGIDSSWSDFFLGLVMVLCIIITSISRNRTRKKLLIFD
ncbi:MAG: ABC transporter permease [Lachnospiraceae bacterium]|jgi:simple sugar transport system permease protein